MKNWIKQIFVDEWDQFPMYMMFGIVVVWIGIVVVWVLGMLYFMFSSFGLINFMFMVAATVPTVLAVIITGRAVFHLLNKLEDIAYRSGGFVDNEDDEGNFRY